MGAFPDSSWEAAIGQHMTNMQKDLGCIEFIKVAHSELSSTSFERGILFIFGEGCYSAMGQAPGLSDDINDIAGFGAPPTWQIISLDAVF